MFRRPLLWELTRAFLKVLFVNQMLNLSSRRLSAQCVPWSCHSLISKSHRWRLFPLYLISLGPGSMEAKVISSGIRYSSLPSSYIRPESERPKLSEVADCENVPVIDLGCGNRSLIIKQIGDACHEFGFFQVIYLCLIVFMATCSWIGAKSFTMYIYHYFHYL